MAGIGGTSGAIEREVQRRIGADIAVELIRIAIEDVLEGRRPRW